MSKRNHIADAFFDCVSAFSENTGANTFDSRVERGGKDGKGELEKMVCLAGYEKYDIEYTYFVRSPLVSSIVSIFDVRVIFDRRRPEIKYSLYDVMYIMDPDNFRCYHFSFIETPERMKKIFASIESDLRVFLARLAIIASQKTALDDLEDKFKDGVNSFFGYDIFTSEDDSAPGHDLYISALEHYYALSDSFYESKAYALFLAGKYKKAYAGMCKYRKKTYYQVRLSSFISVDREKYDAVAEGCNSVYDAAEINKYQNLRIILGALILFIPLLFLHVGAHFLYAKLIFSGALWSTAFTLPAAFGSAPFVFPFSVALSYIFNRFTIKLVSKKKRAYLKNLESVAAPFSRSGCARVLIFILLTFLILTSLLNVNSFTAFFEDGFRYKTSLTDISGVYYSYSDISELVLVKGRYDQFGKYEEFPSYVIIMKSGVAIDLIYEVTDEDAEKRLVLLLRDKGVPFTEVHDLSEKGSILG